LVTGELARERSITNKEKKKYKKGGLYLYDPINQRLNEVDEEALMDAVMPPPSLDYVERVHRRMVEEFQAAVLEDKHDGLVKVDFEQTTYKYSKKKGLDRRIDAFFEQYGLTTPKQQKKMWADFFEFQPEEFDDEAILLSRLRSLPAEYREHALEFLITKGNKNKRKKRRRKILEKVEGVQGADDVSILDHLNDVSPEEMTAWAAEAKLELTNSITLMGKKLSSLMSMSDSDLMELALALDIGLPETPERAKVMLEVADNLDVAINHAKLLLEQEVDEMVTATSAAHHQRWLDYGSFIRYDTDHDPDSPTQGETIVKTVARALQDARDETRNALLKALEGDADHDYATIIELQKQAAMVEEEMFRHKLAFLKEMRSELISQGHEWRDKLFLPNQSLKMEDSEGKITEIALEPLVTSDPINRPNYFHILEKYGDEEGLKQVKVQVYAQERLTEDIEQLEESLAELYDFATTNFDTLVPIYKVEAQASRMYRTPKAPHEWVANYWNAFSEVSKLARTPLGRDLGAEGIGAYQLAVRKWNEMVALGEEKGYLLDMSVLKDSGRAQLLRNEAQRYIAALEEPLMEKFTKADQVRIIRSFTHFEPLKPDLMRKMMAVEDISIVLEETDDQDLVDNMRAFLSSFYGENITEDDAKNYHG
jgi:hypothetical protein